MSDKRNIYREMSMELDSLDCSLGLYDEGGSSKYYISSRLDAFQAANKRRYLEDRIKKFMEKLALSEKISNFYNDEIMQMREALKDLASVERSFIEPSKKRKHNHDDYYGNDYGSRVKRYRDEEESRTDQERSCGKSREMARKYYKEGVDRAAQKQNVQENMGPASSAAQKREHSLAQRSKFAKECVKEREIAQYSYEQRSLALRRKYKRSVSYHTSFLPKGHVSASKSYTPDMDEATYQKYQASIKSGELLANEFFDSSSSGSFIVTRSPKTPM